MSTILHLAGEVEQSLLAALPKQRKTQRTKLALAVATSIEAQTANTAELSNLLPLPKTERADMRYQWFSRLLGNRHIVADEVIRPFARQALVKALEHGPTLVVMLDQTQLGRPGARHGALMLSLRYGDRAVPLFWRTKKGEGNLGIESQRELLDLFRDLLGELLAEQMSAARVLLLGDRFFGTTELIRYCQQHGFDYRLRLRGDITADTGQRVTTTGALAEPLSGGNSGGNSGGVYLKAVYLGRGTGDSLRGRVQTNIGIVHDAGHEEPWIIAMSAEPSRTSTLDYGLRGSIECQFSDFKSRGLGLEQTQLQYTDRVDRLLLALSLALHWSVWTGETDRAERPTVDEKKPSRSSVPQPQLSGG